MNKATFHRSKYIFTLNISPFQIDQRYGFNFTKRKNRPIETTQIKDLFEDETGYVSFLDSSKKNKRWLITMKNLITKTNLPVKTEIRCFNCHHEFDTRP